MLNYTALHVQLNESNILGFLLEVHVLRVFADILSFHFVRPKYNLVSLDTKESIAS